MSPSPPSGWAAWTPPNCRSRTLDGLDGRRFDLMLSTPEGGPPEAGWPFLVVLDGERFFGAVAGAAASLARRREKTGVAPLVVIGVAHRPDQGAVEDQRAMDFTRFECAQPEGARPGGGGARFGRFLAETVLSEVERVAAIDRARATLFGHSLAGLFVLETLEAEPALFTRWAAVSPSLWWRTPDAAHARPDLLVGCGELETARDMRGRIEAWAGGRGHDGPAFRLAPLADHGAAPFALIPDILRHASRDQV
jgi:predicted alpha/beta superfamily hydrolase